MKNTKPTKSLQPLVHPHYGKVQPVSKEEATAMSKIPYGKLLGSLLY